MSGHITVQDALRDSNLKIDETVGRRTLEHEAIAEIGYSLPIIERSQFLGAAHTKSVGGHEVCNCEALVFTLNYDRVLESIATPEVAELRSFRVSEITAAMADASGLRGRDGVVHPFADNFEPVFRTFLRSLAARVVSAAGA